jgi:hypothetical protein
MRNQKLQYYSIIFARENEKNRKCTHTPLQNMGALEIFFLKPQIGEGVT